MFFIQPADRPDQVQWSLQTAARSWEQGQEGLMISRKNIYRGERKNGRKNGD